MQRLAVFCWTVLVLVHTGGTLAPSSSYECSPSDQGLLCADGKRCCHEGHRCSADSLWCIKQELPSVVMCGDLVSECPNANTCCEKPDGSWGCCPVPKAVCCEDKVHCCPEGTSCDVERSRCVSRSSLEDTPMWDKLPARKRADWENQRANPVPCSTKAFCPDGSTCCRNQEGNWSCCPLPKAVCCSDLIHCCPEGYTCNTAAQTCDTDSGSVAWLEKAPALPKQDVVCDNKHTCEEGSTCCKNSAGQWGCCPLPQAVCCEDGDHCCPAHYKCDEQRSKCILQGVTIPWYAKRPAVSTETPPQTPGSTFKPQQVPCQDHSTCRDGQTCCKISSAAWGCCPLPNAVCCSDMEHCCPSGFTCTAAGRCIRGPEFL